MRLQNLLRVLLIFLLSHLAFSQALEYRRHVQGNLFLPPGTAAQNSRIRIQLKYCSGNVGRVPVNPGNPPGPSGIIVSFVPFEVNVQANGSWGTDLYGNDQILCGTDTSGPSRWFIQPVYNGVANAGAEYQIQSCGVIPYNACSPFLPDSAPSCSLTVTTNCNMNGGTVGPDTWVTINGVVAVPNALDFNNRLLPPAGSTPVTFMLNGNNVSAYVTGTGGGGGGGITGATPNGGLLQSGSTLGLITTCTTSQYLSWNGTSWICTTLTGGGGGGVTSINNVTGAFTFSGSGVSCNGTTCQFTGGTGGTLPIISQYNLFASTGSGAAQDTGLMGGSGFLKGQVMLATGDITSAAAPFPLAPNASMEYFPSGYGSIGTSHGLGVIFSHSSATTAAGNGGVGLGGGNTSGVGNQIYLDCEVAGCDFKVPPTYNGSSIGGGGGGITGPTPNGGLVQSGTTLGMLANCTSGQYLSWNGTTWACTTLTAASGTVSAGTINQFAYYSGTTTVASNAHLNDGLTTANVITSSETFAAPQVNLTGTGGAAMTSSGGTLPTPTAGVGGVGIGPGAVPEISVNGGAWTPIGALPSTTNLLAGNGFGGAVDSTIQGQANYLKAGALLSGGGVSTSPFTGANAALQWYGNGASLGGITFPNGVATYYAHGSGTTGATTNAGVAFLGGSTTTASDQVYLDCEHAGCDFKVPVTQNGSAIGGGGGGITGGTAGQIVVATGATTIGTSTALSANGPAITSSGGTLPTLTSPTGGFGFAANGVPEISSNGSGFYPLQAILVNSAFPLTGQVATDFSGTTPAAPTNGHNVTWSTSGMSSNTVQLSAALVGDGVATDCFIGTGVFAACPGGGGGMTWPAAAGIAVYSGSSSWSPSYTTSNPIPISQGGTGNSVGNAATATQLNATPTLCPTGQAPTGVLANGNATGCAAITGAGSGTVSANNTVANAVATYAAAGGSTTVGPSNGTMVLTNGTGTTTLTAPAAAGGALNSSSVISVPAGTGCSGGQPSIAMPTSGTGWSFASANVTGCLNGGTYLNFSQQQLGINTTDVFGIGAGGSSDTNWGRVVAGLWSAGTGSAVSETAYLRSANSCAVVTPVSFTTTPGTICSRTLPASQKDWILRCSIPFAFTAGSGSGAITILTTAAASSWNTANTNWFTSQLWAGTAPTWTTLSTNSGNMTLSLGSVTVATGTPFFATVEGVVSESATGGLFAVQISTSTGTGQIQPGSYCRFE